MVFNKIIALLNLFIFYLILYNSKRESEGKRERVKDNKTRKIKLKKKSCYLNSADIKIYNINPNFSA